MLKPPPLVITPPSSPWQAISSPVEENCEAPIDVTYNNNDDDDNDDDNDDDDTHELEAGN